ncbi:MAG: sterol desaturase family protein [Saprospiraceae bacterium]
MKEYATVLLFAIPFFIVLIAIEFLIGRAKGVQTYRGFDTISSLSSGMTNTLKEVLGLSIVIISYRWIYDHVALYEVEAKWWIYVICFIGLDFAGYWAHRFEHVINIFWNRHIVHHSSEEFNLACALRQPISNVVALFTFLLLPTALLGVPPKVIAVIAPLHLFAQFWYHTRLINKLGFLEHIIVTPSHHRVHHAINDVYLDKNYGQIFIVWDKWVGTFQEELSEVTPVYGVKRAVKTWNPILINYQHLWLLIKDAFRTQRWKDKLQIWFKPTGWRPEDVAKKYPVESITDPFSYEKFQTPSGPVLSIWAWLQLTINLLLMLHMMYIIADITIYQLFQYGLFLFVSIYGYTALMDQSKQAIVAEIIKMGIVISIIYMQGTWFGIAAFVIISYTLISVLSSCYFLLFQKNHI